ncbi:MAG: DegQ family serine endoprotease [candidate division FCPU426 bacterium]
MKTKLHGLIKPGLALAAALLATPAWPAAMIPATFSDVAEKVGPAVVNISAVRIVQSPFAYPQQFADPQMQEFFEYFFGPQFQREMPPQQSTSLGSGVIVDPEGYILTNNHVVEKSAEILVKTNDGKEYKAKIVGTDPKTDVAVLKLEGRRSWPAAGLGDSDAAKVGDWVVALGSPFGLEQTVTSGIISAKGRVIGQGPYDDFIQTDASINPGNSGGPLVDLEGKVIGINTLIVSRTGGSLGIGFAIPVNMAKRVYQDILKTGQVRRGWLGVYIQPLTPELAEHFRVPNAEGVLITAVTENGPAERGGLKAGDVIVGFNGQAVKNPNELQRLVGGTHGKDTTSVEVLRNGRTVQVKVQVGDQSEAEGAAALPAPRSAAKAPQTGNVLGLMFEDLTPQLARQLRTNDLAGVVVKAVQPGSPAEGAGIQPGDIIREINRLQVKNRGVVDKALKALKPGEELLLKIERDDYPIYMVMKVPEK